MCNLLYYLLLCQVDTVWSYLRERSFSWGNASMRSSCGTFSQLVSKQGGPLVGGVIPWLVVLVSIKKQAEQASKKHPSMASASAPVSWPAWVPVLTSFGDKQLCKTISLINPFLPNWLLGRDVLSKNRHHDYYTITDWLFMKLAITLKFGGTGISSFVSCIPVSLSHSHTSFLLWICENCFYIAFIMFIFTINHDFSREVEGVGEMKGREEGEGKVCQDQVVEWTGER